MSSEPIKTPSRYRLLVIALVALTIAGGVAGYGIIQRARSAAQVKQWTDAQAISTVALANIQRGVGERKLTLPGTIQPYYRAAIYARVSGYLKSWQADIGAHVKVGELLASIDTRTWTSSSPKLRRTWLLLLPTRSWRPSPPSVGTLW